MNLVVDVGNSRMKWTLVDEADAPWRPAQSVPLEGNLEQILDTSWGGIEAPGRALVSNVGGATRGRQVQEWMEHYWELSPEYFKSTTRAGEIRNDYRRPEQLGADRWAAAIGARSLCNSGSICIVDCGTAITVDGLTTDNRFLGGVIIPGIDLVQDSLLARTSDINESRAEFRGVFGKTTAECVSGGSYLGLAGAIERILEDMVNLLHPTSTYITGGDAQALLPLLDYPLQYEPDLVLIGLASELG